MAEKKRKGVDSSAAQPSKKSKKSVKVAPEPVVIVEETVTPVGSVVVEETAAKPSKKTRKRAADFMQDAPEDDSPKPKKGKKDAKAQVEEPKSLTADGTNGVVEHKDDADITITTSKEPKNKSMMAEAERTQDAEMAEEFGGDDDSADEDIDTAPALLTGFDSDNDDPAEDKKFDSSKVAPIPQFKKTSKKLRQAKESGSDGPGVVYVGRIPHGFYETPMREYFSQFGTITQLRLSRNKKTGASKHFAFIEFESDEVAKIVADTMDNYLMFGHILKCKYAPAETLHADVWKGANKKYRKIPQHKLLKQKSEETKSDKQMEKKMKNVQAKREKKLKKMQEMGYNYDLPTLVKPDANAGLIEDVKETDPVIGDNVEGALVPPPNVPKDELAVKIEQKQKKAKKDKKGTAKDTVPEAIEKVDPAAEQPTRRVSQRSTKGVPSPFETPVAVVEEVVAVVEEPKAKKAKKGKEAAVEVVVAPVVTEEVVATETTKPAKKSKKGKKEEAAVVLAESAPAIAEIAVAVEEAAPKKSKKGKKEAIVDPTPAIIEEVAALLEEAPKKSKKSKKESEVASESKVDKKQLKSILKKTGKKA